MSAFNLFRLITLGFFIAGLVIGWRLGDILLQACG